MTQEQRIQSLAKAQTKRFVAGECDQEDHGLLMDALRFLAKHYEVELWA